MNQQNISWTAFATGLTTFLGMSGELITEHTTWQELMTPLGVVHLIALGGAFVVMVGGALGAQLPRIPGTHIDRVDDPAPAVRTKADAPLVSPDPADRPDPPTRPADKEP